MENMNDPLNNLPPFYVGQKVVCVSNYDGWRYKVKVKKFFFFEREEWKRQGNAPHKNEVCTVSSIYVYEGAWMVKLREYPQDHAYTAKDFKPLQQAGFPLMTFSEILTKEKTEVLVEN